MRRRAIEILGALGTVGENGEVVSALKDVLEDESAAISLRCIAAEAMGRLDYGQTAAIDPKKVAETMASVAARACYSEIERVEKQHELEEKDKETSTTSRGRLGSLGSHADVNPTQPMANIW